MVERYSYGSGGSMVTRFMLVRPIEIHSRVGCVTWGAAIPTSLYYGGCVSGEGWPLCAKFVAFGLYAFFLWPDFISQSLLILRGQQLTLEPL